jgi:hypothetical protein
MKSTFAQIAQVFIAALMLYVGEYAFLSLKGTQNLQWDPLFVKYRQWDNDREAIVTNALGYLFAPLVITDRRLVHKIDIER